MKSTFPDAGKFRRYLVVRLLFRDNRPKTLLADSDVVDPDGKPFTGCRLIIGPANRKGLEFFRNLGALELAGAFMDGNLGFVRAVDEELVGLRRGIDVPLE